MWTFLGAFVIEIKNLEWISKKSNLLRYEQWTCLEAKQGRNVQLFNKQVWLFLYELQFFVDIKLRMNEYITI